MSFENEKRLGRERRQVNCGAPQVFSERRRLADRRQFAIEDIPFIEWASHFAKYQKVNRHVHPGTTSSKAY